MRIISPSHIAQSGPLCLWKCTRKKQTQTHKLENPEPWTNDAQITSQVQIQKVYDSSEAC